MPDSILEDHLIRRPSDDDEAPHPARWVNPSNSRCALLREGVHAKLNPFVLCHVLVRRTRQLATRYPGELLSQVIKIAMSDLREGKLQEDIQRFSSQSDGAKK